MFQGKQGNKVHNVYKTWNCARNRGQRFKDCEEAEKIKKKLKSYAKNYLKLRRNKSARSRKVHVRSELSVLMNHNHFDIHDIV